MNIRRKSLSLKKKSKLYIDADQAKPRPSSIILTFIINRTSYPRGFCQKIFRRKTLLLMCHSLLDQGETSLVQSNRDKGEKAGKVSICSGNFKNM